jgi:hypothetical protein
MHHGRAQVAWNTSCTCIYPIMPQSSIQNFFCLEYSRSPLFFSRSILPSPPLSYAASGNVHMTHAAHAVLQLTSHTYQYVANRAHRTEPSSSSAASSPSSLMHIPSMQPLPSQPIASPAAASVVSASHPIAFDIFCG